MRSRTGTRTGDVMDAIRRRMASRALSPGERLPSIRGFAATMGVSPSTVVEAYDRPAGRHSGGADLVAPEPGSPR